MAIVEPSGDSGKRVFEHRHESLQLLVDARVVNTLIEQTSCPGCQPIRIDPVGKALDQPRPKFGGLLPCAQLLRRVRQVDPRHRQIREARDWTAPLVQRLFDPPEPEQRLRARQQPVLLRPGAGVGKEPVRRRGELRLAAGALPSRWVQTSASPQPNARSSLSGCAWRTRTS